MLLKILIIVVSLFYATGGYAGVYKCKDDNGRVVFSDTACSAKEREFIDVEALREEQLRRAPIPARASGGAVKSLQSRQEKYHCDGRTRCSQMTSCEEATFFVNNCPDTKMDGNNDGIPCEKQWCK